MEEGSFVAYITLKNGKRLYAKSFGKKAFFIPAKKPKKGDEGVK